LHRRTPSLPPFIISPSLPRAPASAGACGGETISLLRSCQAWLGGPRSDWASGSSPARAARGGNAATQSHGAKNEADPRVGRWFLPLLCFLVFFSFSFSSQTARQLVFCLSIVSFFHFLSFHAVTSVYYCCYLLLWCIRYAVCVCQCIYVCLVCKMSLSHRVDRMVVWGMA